MLFTTRTLRSDILQQRWPRWHHAQRATWVPSSASHGHITRCAADHQASATAKHAQRYNWNFDKEVPMHKAQRLVRELPVAAIARPLGKTRANDQDKVAALMESIQEIGLQEPIDVLEVDGKYFGFSGCHRFEAHVKLGKPTILCRVRKATARDLKLHMM